MNGSLLIEVLVSVLVFVVCFFVFAKHPDDDEDRLW